MLVHPFAALRQLFDRRPAPEPAPPSATAEERSVSQQPAVRRAPTHDDPPARSGETGRVAGLPGRDEGSRRSGELAHLIATYLGARVEDILELLFEATAQRVADEVTRVFEAAREGWSADIAGIRESTAGTQRESSRMGRELVRTGATLEGVQTSLSEAAAALKQLEATLQAERQSAQQIRDEAWSETLGDVLATLDGLEAALDEARGIARALGEVRRQIDDPAVRRWWRALGEATGTKRPLPAVPVSDVASWVSGLELTYRRLRDALERRGIVAIEAAGAPFDPHWHEAVAVMPCPPEQDGIVLREERRGYRTADRVVRLAQVVVGKAAPSTEKVRHPRRKAGTGTGERTTDDEGVVNDEGTANDIDELTEETASE